MAAHFEVYKDSSDQYRFRLLAEDGENLLSSEAYKQKSSAQNGVESVRKNAQNDARYERKEASNGKPMFNLKAANGEVIGTSKLHETSALRDQGIEAVKSVAPGAAVDDHT